MQITPQRFMYKPTKSNPIETFVHAGFIAQNVKEVIPEAVARQRSGYYSLDTTAVLAAAVNAIKQLKERNDRQSAEINKLRSENLNHLAQSERHSFQIQNLQNRLSEIERSIVIRTAGLRATKY